MRGERGESLPEHTEQTTRGCIGSGKKDFSQSDDIYPGMEPARLPDNVDGMITIPRAEDGEGTTKTDWTSWFSSTRI
jgi:hypothetical protein